jgi:hypothetical protein
VVVIDFMARPKHDKRMCDAISLRVLPEQRTFLERIAEKNKVGLCEAGRIVIAEAMRARGIEC